MRPKGMPKTGGRKPGSLNKRTRAIRARLLRDEELTVESTVEAIRRGQQYDIRRLLDKRGNFKPLQDLSEEEAWCIAGVEVIIKNAKAGDGHVDEVLKLKFIDRGRYVELAAKHQGMLVERMEVDVTAAGERLERAREAARLRHEGQKALGEAQKALGDGNQPSRMPQERRSATKATPSMGVDSRKG